METDNAEEEDKEKKEEEVEPVKTEKDLVKFLSSNLLICGFYQLTLSYLTLSGLKSCLFLDMLYSIILFTVFLATG